MYWYYRRETIETYGEDKILIVCEKGNGLRNFKVLSRKGTQINVGFSIGPVNSPKISMYINRKMVEAAISQAYYILDVASGKIIRTQLIGPKAIFPPGFKKKAILFGTRDNIGYKLIKNSSESRLQPYDISTDKNVNSVYDSRWIKIDDLPENVFLFDFENGTVQKVHEVTFTY